MRPIFLIIVLILFVQVVSSAPLGPRYSYSFDLDLIVPREVLSDPAWQSFTLPIGSETDVQRIFRNYLSFEEVCDDLLPIQILIDPSSEERQELEPDYALMSNERLDVKDEQGRVSKKWVYMYYTPEHEPCYWSFDVIDFSMLVEDIGVYRLKFNNYVTNYEDSQLAYLCDHRLHCQLQLRSFQEEILDKQYVLVLVHPQSHKIIYSEMISTLDLLESVDRDGTTSYDSFELGLAPRWYEYVEGGTDQEIAGFDPNSVKKQEPRLVEDELVEEPSEEPEDPVQENDSEVFSPHLPQPPVIPEEIGDDLLSQQQEKTKSSWWQSFKNFFSSLFS